MEFNFDDFINGTSNVPPVNYAKKQNFTNTLIELVEKLHHVLPDIQNEITDLGNKARAKPCDAFKEKMEGLRTLYLAIKNAEPNLYYWYIEQPKRAAS